MGSKNLIEEIEERKVWENMRAEDVLEYLFQLSNKWEKEKDPIEAMRDDLRTMISAFKENKFEKMGLYLGLSF